MKEIKAVLKNWNTLDINEFVAINTKKFNIYVIKFRNTMGNKIVFNEVEPVNGVKLIDVMGIDDYFVGEFVVIDKKFNITLSKNAIILHNKNRKTTMKEIRNDGFLKIYRTINSSYVITTL
jgi:hypothetical protein